MDSIALFKESLDWLKNNYTQYEFFTERDIVWTIQIHLRKRAKELELPCRIVNDWPMTKSGIRSICADLVILQDDQVLLAAEFKYEPDHDRKEDFSKSKLKQCVVFWRGASNSHSVEKDIERIREYVESNKAKTGCSIFIDEGGRFCDKETFPGSRWERWDEKTAALISWREKGGKNGSI